MYKLNLLLLILNTVKSKLSYNPSDSSINVNKLIKDLYNLQSIEPKFDENGLIIIEENPLSELGRRLQDMAADKQSQLNVLNGYGCWCDFQNYHGGKGIPLDYLDNECRKLHSAYECGSIGEAEGGNDCVMHEQIYNGGALLGKMLTTAIVHKTRGNLDRAVKTYKRMVNYCREQNQFNTCHASACQIELTFLYVIAPQAYYTNVESSDGFNSAYSHSLSNFNFDDTCLTPKSQPTVLSCCGKIPFQIQYNSLNNNIECCNGASQVFNPVTDCCSRTQVVPC